MNRLQQSRRGTFGYVQPPQVQNNPAIVPSTRNPYLVMEQSLDQNSYDDMDGEGIMDMARGIINKGKQGAKWAWSNRDKIKQAGEKASDFYASETGTALRNIIPDSDKTARPAYAGERHAILELPNGKYGTANYMGPGTQIIKRLKRGDPPRTQSDKTAMRHDIDYTMAANAPNKVQQDKMVREADQRMIKNLNRIAKNKGDAKKNIFQGRRLIQGKMAAEDLGLMARGSFGGPLHKDSASDMLILKKNQDQLGQEGFGMLPAQALKMKLVRQHRKRANADKKGKGLLQDMRKITADAKKFQSGQMGIMPVKLKGKGYPIPGAGLTVPGSGLKIPGGALRLAGQRGLTPAYMRKINKVCKCEAMKGEGIGSIFKSVINAIAPVAKAVGPTLLKEIVLPLAKGYIEKKVKGKGSSGQGLHTGGDGLRLAGQRHRGGRISMSKSYGTMKNYEMKGKGISLPGGMYMGSGDVMAFLMKGVVPNLAKSVGVDLSTIPIRKITPIIGKAIKMAKAGDVKGIVDNVSKVLLPFLAHGKLKTMGAKLSGGGIKDVLGEVSYRLQKPLATGLYKAMKWYLKRGYEQSKKGQSGRGLGLPGGSWGNFWKGFKKGFTTVFKPGAKVLGGVASAMGQPEIGIPLEIVSGML